jgi:hypothetical protein
MWDWLRRLMAGELQRPSTRPTYAALKANTPGFWIQTSGPSLAQGDFLRDCLVPIFNPGFRVGTVQEQDVQVCAANLIIVTQSCDLENNKAQFVALCPIYSVDDFTRINPRFSKKHERDEIRKGRHEGLHMLASPTNPDNNLEALIVDFRQIYSLPFEHLTGYAANLGSRWRLQSPFLEHFSQSFARFFMRVGLPSSIPPFR